MKLLLFIPSLGSGGAERQLVSLALIFKEAGHDVEFLIYHKDFFYEHILSRYSIRVNYLETSNSIDRILKIRRFIRSNDWDTVISFLETPSFIACLSAIGGKKWKLITTELSSKKSTFQTLRGRLFCYSRKYSDFIVCNSYNAKAMWLSHYSEYKDKLRVIYNPVILPQIDSQYTIKKDGKLNIVIAASYQYLKNPIGLINALNLMDVNFRNKISINWYGRKEITKGDTAAYDEAVFLIKKFKLSNIISLNDPTTDIANKMNQADVVALFSELEGLPNAICEAMMIGKPIIMTKFSDYSVLIDGNGFLCDWNDPNSIKDALEKAINLSHSEIKDYGLKSRRKALNLFSPDLVLKEWIDICR